MNRIRDENNKLKITLDGGYRIYEDSPTKMGNPGSILECMYKGWDEALHPGAYAEAVANTLLCQEAFQVAFLTDRTPKELLRERDDWEDEATRLNGELERLERRRGDEMNDYLEATHDQQIEIQRLREMLDEAVKYLRQGKREFAPNTTNSLVDGFLQRFDVKLNKEGTDENE